MTYSCTLFDENSNTFLLIESENSDYKVFEGLSENDLTSVKTITVHTYRDGGSVVAYLEDGRIIYVPQKMFMNDFKPVVSKWMTRQQQHSIDAMEHNEIIGGPNFMDPEQQVEAGDEPADYSPSFFEMANSSWSGVTIRSLKMGDRTYV